MPIPASALVQVVPSVENAGALGVILSGLFLTTNTRIPIGSVLSFPSALAVGEYCGLTSTEAAAAQIYFAGYNGATSLPGAMLLSQYNTTAVGAYLRGGDISALPLTTLQSYTGTLSLTVNDTVYTSSSISLSGATSFSNAATLIGNAFTSPPFAVTYDSVSGAFVFTDSTVGADSTITYATTGSLATDLLLTQATGAVLSQGSAAQTSPNAYMAALVAQNPNWGGFATLFNPDDSGNANKLLFADWVATTNNEWAYACWDTDITPTESTDASDSLGQLLNASASSGTCLVWGTDYTKAVFILGWMASQNFQQENGASSLAFKNQSGLTPDVTSQTVAANLEANYYNYYGSWANATTEEQGIYPGFVSGDFQWMDAYTQQIWLNSSFQAALFALLFQVPSIPYNNAGYSLIKATLQTVIDAALNFGAIQTGVTLSATQVAEINYATNTTTAAQAIQFQGYYLQVIDPGAAARAARQTPVINFYYTQGGSVNEITLSSVEVQ